MSEELNVSKKFYYLLHESIYAGFKEVAERLKKDEAAKGSDELILYMELGYPVRFGYCRPCDFREVYFAHQTDIEVELPGKGYDSVVYEYTRLNTCAPILRTNYCDLIAPESNSVEYEFLDNISHTIIGHRDKWLGQWHDDYKMDGAGKFWIAKQIVNTYAADYFFDYLFYRLLDYHKNSLVTKVKEQTWYEEDCIDSLVERACAIYPFFKEIDGCEIKKIKRILKRLDYSYNEETKEWVAEESKKENYYHNVYFITCADNTERWLFFDAFYGEAKKIKYFPGACEVSTIKYRPSYRILFDLEELCVFDMWQRFGYMINLDFLKQDWYDMYAYNPESLKRIQRHKSNEEYEDYLNLWYLKYFKGRAHRVLSRKEAMLECVIAWWDNDDDCFVNESDVELRRLQFVPSTMWGCEVPDKPLVWMDENAPSVEEDVRESLDFQAHLRIETRKYKN